MTNSHARDRCPFLLEIRSHVAHYVKYTFLCFESCCLQPFLVTPASLFFSNVPLVTFLVAVAQIFGRSTICRLLRPYLLPALPGFSKEPCLFCRPGFFRFTVTSSMGFDVPICPSYHQSKLVCKWFWENGLWALLSLAMGANLWLQMT